MGKLQVFEVVFNGDNVDLFQAGDWVEGYVNIVLSEPKKDIRGIKIKYKGKAKTMWSEDSGDNKRHYHSKEKYFEKRILILGKDKKDSSGEKVHLAAGEHKFPFRFQIPSKPLPHPYEAHLGHVRYKVSAKIDRPWKFDHTTQRLFTIVGAGVDLNAMQDAQLPARAEHEKTVCCFCCASGPIKVSAQTDKSGYVPGETIWVSGVIDNQSGRDIIDITASLVQKVEFRARRNGTGAQHVRKETMILVQQTIRGCGEYQTVTFDRKPIVVPSCPPTGLVGCNIIHIEYVINFDADVSGTPLDASVVLPITIGTVPLARTYADAYSPGTPITQQPSAPQDVLPPPSYQVAMGGLLEIPSKTGHDYTFGKLMYAPRYPYYNFPPPTGNDPAHPPPAPPSPAPPSEN